MTSFIHTIVHVHRFEPCRKVRQLLTGSDKGVIVIVQELSKCQHQRMHNDVIFAPSIVISG